MHSQLNALPNQLNALPASSAVTTHFRVTEPVHGYPEVALILNSYTSLVATRRQEVSITGLVNEICTAGCCEVSPTSYSRQNCHQGGCFEPHNKSAENLLICYLNVCLLDGFSERSSVCSTLVACTYVFSLWVASLVTNPLKTNPDYAQKQNLNQRVD